MQKRIGFARRPLRTQPRRAGYSGQQLRTLAAGGREVNLNPKLRRQTFALRQEGLGAVTRTDLIDCGPAFRALQFSSVMSAGSAVTRYCENPAPAAHSFSLEIRK
jgi:hypothetical protein